MNVSKSPACRTIREPGKGDIESPAMGLGCHELDRFSHHGAPILADVAAAEQL